MTCCSSPEARSLTRTRTSSGPLAWPRSSGPVRRPATSSVSSKSGCEVRLSRPSPVPRDEAILRPVGVRKIGLSADEIAMIAYHQCLHAQESTLRMSFVECNEERAKSFASELSDTVNGPVQPLVLGALTPTDLAGNDLVVTTFFHHAELRRH